MAPTVTNASTGNSPSPLDPLALEWERAQVRGNYLDELRLLDLVRRDIQAQRLHYLTAKRPDGPGQVIHELKALGDVFTRSIANLDRKFGF